jgi:hypothetical protein
MQLLNDGLILLAQSATSSGKGLSLSWGIVIFFILLGMAVTLSPPKRTYEVKRPKDD